MFDPRTRATSVFKMISWIQIIVISMFVTFPSGIVHAQTFNVFSLPKPGSIVTTSQKYDPLLIKGISLHKENPLVFDFILDPGDSGYSDLQVKIESQRLIKYFFASLTVPDKDLWVNLSPYEKDRIIPEGFGQTEMGRDLLAQDYILKQLSASLIYPEKDLGKDFWNRVYRKAKEVYGTTDIPVNTFNKVWIIPDRAVIVENETNAYITRAHLKVLLEEDYVSLNENRANEVLGTSQLDVQDVKTLSSVSSAIVRDIVLPEIEREVNEGKNFVQLRQIYYSLILSTWFKKNLKENILNQIYSNQYKVLGVNVKDKTDKEKIYQQYLAAFREGVFNYIKEDLDETTREVIPRKYFSGGTAFDKTAEVIDALSVNTPAGASELQNATADRTSIVVTAGASRSEVLAVNQEITQKIEDLKSADQGTRAQAIEFLIQNGDETAIAPLNEVLFRTPEMIVLADTTSVVNPERAKIQEAIGAIEKRVQLKNDPSLRKKSLLGGVSARISDFVTKGMSLLDASYLKALYSKFLVGREELQLNKTIVASASLEEGARQKVFGVFDSKGIVGQDEFKTAASGVALRVIQMKGGLGTSYKRERTVKRITGRDKLADKATDSFFEQQQVGESTVDVNVASLKAQQYIRSAQANIFGEVTVQELVNDESLGPVNQFYESPYYLDQTKTVGDAFRSTPGLKLDENMIVQGVLPVVDGESFEFIENPKATAPGGHGFLGTLTLDRIANNAPSGQMPTVTVIVNGDGVNNFIPEEVVGWMVKQKIPILMLTTTKTGLDLKGGLVVAETAQPISQELTDKLNRNELLNAQDINGLTLTPQLFEIAQAKTVGQEDLFQEMGITRGEQGGQFFNTNLSAYNEDVLHPFLRELKEILGADRYFEITSPDLIANPKEKEIDGVKKEVFQMEGAKGSALLNLNKFVMTTTDAQVLALKAKYGIERLVYFVNFDANNRTQVFTPEKYAWDHGVFEHSDLFQVNVQTGRLEKKGDQGKLPAIDLDKYYTDIENINLAWGQTVGMQELDFLGIKGKVHFPNAILKGTVLIQSFSPEVIDLNSYKQMFNISSTERLLLENIFIRISETGEITIEAITDAKKSIAIFEQKDISKVTNTVKQSEDLIETNEVEKGIQLLSADGQNAEYGGIDFDPDNIKMEINKQNGGINVEFDPKLLEEIRNQGINGIVPVILNIRRVENIIPLLSENANNELLQTAKI